MIAWFLSAAVAAPCYEQPIVTPGTTSEVTWLDKKGKLRGKVSVETRSGTAGQLRLHEAWTDKKGNDLAEVEYGVNCEAGSLALDMRSAISPGTWAAYAQAGQEIEAEKLVYPAELTVGQELPAASVTANFRYDPAYTPPDGTARPNGMVHIELRDRKVVGQETITTSAGTFEVYKITRERYSKARSSNESESTRPETVWFAPGLGVVRIEVAKSNGKLVNSAEITSLSPAK